MNISQNIFNDPLNCVYEIRRDIDNHIFIRLDVFLIDKLRQNITYNYRSFPEL